jgi:hypothetical protein
VADRRTSHRASEHCSEVLGPPGVLINSRAASRRRWINRRDRTDRIGDLVVGQAAAGAQNGGRDLETTFGRHAGIVSRLATSGALMFLRLESLFDKSFHGSCLLLSAFNSERVSRLNRSGVLTSTLYPSSLAKRTLHRQIPNVGARCVKYARRDLCRGCSTMSTPTAIALGVRVAIEQHFR